MISHQTGSSFDTGGQYLSEDGWYHLAITDATDTPTKQDGSLINGAMFRLSCVACAGTSANCVDKAVDLTFFAPNTSHKDGGELGRKKIDRALLAVGAISPDQKESSVEIEAAELVGRQFIAHLTKREGQKFLELAYADIFHVDDPEVAQHPKHAEMLATIPPELRRVGSRPAAAPVSAAAAPKPAPAAVPAVSVDEMDI